MKRQLQRYISRYKQIPPIYNIVAPYGDTTIDLKEEDEFAILVIVTVREGAADTTANLKAPLFVNLKKMHVIPVFNSTCSSLLEEVFFQQLLF